MKNLKKVLALVTMFTMLLSVAVSAGALYPDVEDNASYAEAVETLNVLGIMIGDEKGNFNPDASITRAETAAIVTRMKALGNAASGANGTNFSDVAADHWAAGYINLAEQSGIINGYGDGTFGPSDAVTYEQVIKMIVAALGRTPEANSKGGYPSGYMIVAAQEDITAGVSVTAGAEAPRAAVARLVFNALEVDVMEQKDFTPGEESFAVVANKTLLKDYLKVNKYEGVITATYLSKGVLDGDAAIYMSYDKINGVTDEDDALWVEPSVLLEGETGASAYLGYNVSAYAQLDDNDDMVLLGVAKKANRNDVIELAYTDIEAIDEVDGTLEYYETASSSKTTEIDVDFDKAARFFNGGADAGEIADFLDQVGKDAKVSGILTLINNDKDEAYDVLMLKQSTANYVVGAVDAEEKTLEDRLGDAIDIDLEDETILTKFFKADGSAAEFADIAEGNTLTVYANSKENVLSVYISDVTVEGKVTEESVLSNGDKAYKVGDGTYTVAYDVVTSLKVGDEGTFYINVEGKVVDKVATATTGAYAYLYKALETSDINGSTVELKYLTSEGVWETNTLASKVAVVNDGVASSFSMTDGGAAIEVALAGFLKVATEGANKDLLVEDGTDRLFQFGLNSEGKINKLYVGSATGTAANDYISADRTEEGKTYSASQKKLGRIFFNDETKVFSVKSVITEEKDITLTKASALFVDGIAYETVVAYDWENSIPAIAVATVDTSAILGATKLLVITRVSETTNAAGNKITKIYGMQEGQEVSGELSDGTVTVVDATGNKYQEAVLDKDGNPVLADGKPVMQDKALRSGDVVIFSLDAAGAIDNVEVIMAYDAAKAAIDANNGGFAEDDANEDQVTATNMFGYVASKDNGQLWLTKGFEGADVEYEDEAVAIAANGSGINVYEVNVSKSTPTFDTISVSKIKAQTSPNKEAHWALIRVYDDAVVDVVVYKTVTPKATVATPTIKVEEGEATIKCATAGATVYYSVDFVSADAEDIEDAKYDKAFEVVEGDKITAYAVKDGMNDSAEAVWPKVEA